MSTIGPMPNIRAIGPKNESAHTGAVDALTSVMGYTKQNTTMLLGGFVGAPVIVHKGSTITPTYAGVDLTGNADGALYIDEISVQKITADETADIGSLVLVSNDTVPLNQSLKKEDGSVISFADLVSGARFTCKVGWKLADMKKLQIKVSENVTPTAGYLWTIKAMALEESATIATA